LVHLSKNSKKNSKILTGAVKMENILQAFGHASVQGSQNSSRYGLYSEYQFSASGRMLGVKTIDYLLEKDRITAAYEMAEGERNFHIFYQLIAGKIKLFLKVQAPRPKRKKICFCLLKVDHLLIYKAQSNMVH
jgi:chitin synthase